MVCNQRVRLVWLLAASLLVVSGVVAPSRLAAQEDSLIFPSMINRPPTPPTWPGRSDHVPAHIATAAVYEQMPVPAIIPESSPQGIPEGAVIISEGEVCPHCGKVLERPIQDVCGACLHPGRRLLSVLRRGRGKRGLLGATIPREPWLYRPFCAGIFFGPMVGSPLIDDWVVQQTGTIAGARFGWDFDDDWGMETRLASASLPLIDSELAIALQQVYDTERGLPEGSLYRNRLDGTRLSDHFLWDVDVLWYPWGEAALRPYLLFGIGISRIEFMDRVEVSYSRILVGMPVGIGVKHRWTDWLAFRVECLDNMGFGGNSAFEMQHNVSLTGGFEIRFGRPRVSYWPWNPGMRKW